MKTKKLFKGVAKTTGKAAKATGKAAKTTAKVGVTIGYLGIALPTAAVAASSCVMMNVSSNGYDMIMDLLK